MNNTPKSKALRVGLQKKPTLIVKPLVKPTLQVIPSRRKITPNLQNFA